jgi:hypothetical protein
VAERRLRKGEVAGVRFLGGALDGEVKPYLDVRHWYRFYYRAGAGVKEGQSTYDRYDWDPNRNAMIYRGTVQGHGDDRHLERRPTKTCKEERAWLALPPAERRRRAQRRRAAA